MPRIVKNLFLLMAGIAIGWSVHAVFVPDPSIPAPNAVIQVATERTSPVQQWPSTTTQESARVIAQPRALDRPRHFRRLLEQQRFEEAVIFYTDSLYLAEQYRAVMRPVLDDYLKTCLSDCTEGTFITLVDAWLDSYYEDIAVLLLLAEYQQRQGFPEQAVQVMQMAMTYAYQDGQRQQVRQALRQLVRSTDKTYGAQQRWIELLGFYELLAALAMEEPAYGLRRASLYRLLDEPERARLLLLDLQAADNGLDAALTQALSSQLAELTPEEAPDVLPADGVPLRRRGDHFLVEVTINGQDQLVLMIDTGASVTTLSRTAFDQVSGSRFVHKGSRLFNTANGMTRGDVYLADSLTVGDSRLGNVNVAVLDYDPSPGVDGLLGMNVLRNYRFEIDQDRELLLLRPR